MAERAEALSNKVAELQQGLVTRDVIGQAKGIVMERYRMTADQAFDALRVAPQHMNVRLAVVAATLAETREWPPPKLRTSDAKSDRRDRRPVES